MEKKILDDPLKAQLGDLIKQAKQQFVASRESAQKKSPAAQKQEAVAK